MKIFFNLFIIIILLSNCQNKNKEFNIIGHIDGIKDSTLITLYELDQQLNLDSAYSIDGDFILKGKVKNPTNCWIRCEQEYANLMVENVEMSFTSPIKNMFLYSSIKGGKEQGLYNELKSFQHPYGLIYITTYDSLSSQKYANEEEKQRLIKKFNTAQSTSQDIYVNFGKNHSNSHLGLGIIYMNRKSIPKDSLKLIYQNLSPSFKATTSAKSLEVFLFEKSAEEGKPFIDFEAKNINGNDFKLSSLESNYIYLNFWYSGCRWCRMENKHLSENYSRILKTLSLVSFSMDKDIKLWEKASEKDNIIWHNVSDYEGAKGRIKTQYGVQATPTSFLIDKNGIIIKKFTGFDQKVDRVKELLEIIKAK